MKVHKVPKVLQVHRFKGMYGTVNKKEVTTQASPMFGVNDPPDVLETHIIAVLGGREIVVQKWERGDDLWKIRPKIPRFSDRWPGVSFGSLSCSARDPVTRRV